MAVVWKVRTRVGKNETEGVGRVRAGKDSGHILVFVLYWDGLEMLLGGGWDINR